MCVLRGVLRPLTSGSVTVAVAATFFVCLVLLLLLVDIIKQ